MISARYHWTINELQEHTECHFSLGAQFLAAQLSVSRLIVLLKVEFISQLCERFNTAILRDTVCQQSVSYINDLRYCD